MDFAVTGKKINVTSPFTNQIATPAKANTKKTGTLRSTHVAIVNKPKPVPVTLKVQSSKLKKPEVKP